MKSPAGRGRRVLWFLALVCAVFASYGVYETVGFVKYGDADPLAVPSAQEVARVTAPMVVVSDWEPYKLGPWPRTCVKMWMGPPIPNYNQWTWVACEAPSYMYADLGDHLVDHRTFKLFRPSATAPGANIYMSNEGFNTWILAGRIGRGAWKMSGREADIPLFEKVWAAYAPR